MRRSALHNTFFRQTIQSFFRGSMQEVLIYKKQYEITTQLPRQPSRCASSKKNNPELQRSLERFSFDFSTPAQKILQKRASILLAFISFLFKGLLLDCPVSPENWVAAYFVPRGTKSQPRRTVNPIPLSTHILSFIETNPRGCASNTLPRKEGYEFCLTNCALSLLFQRRRDLDNLPVAFGKGLKEKKKEKKSWSHFQSLFAPVVERSKDKFQVTS